MCVYASIHMKVLSEGTRLAYLVQVQGSTPAGNMCVYMCVCVCGGGVDVCLYTGKFSAKAQHLHKWYRYRAAHLQAVCVYGWV